MDYTKQPLAFKIKKAARYVRLYGLSRTRIKIEAQRHMIKEYQQLPAVRARLPKQHVGIIGCGNFSFGNIAYYLNKNYGTIIAGAMDTHINRAASLFEKYRLAYYADDAEKIIADPDIDLIFIASNHASHAEYAVRALQNDKSVHIEKPHVVTQDQLVRLCAAMTDSKGKVSLGFNRPHGRMGQAIKKALDSQSGASMQNWFIAGHEIPPDHWYFKKEEGGRVLGNLCHWTDFVYQMVPAHDRYPLVINPTSAEKSDCDIAVTYTFGDGSIAAITFSAKGHTFEGVRERYAAHRGNSLIALDDFKRLVIETVDEKRVISPRVRDHGHQEAIRHSYELARDKGSSRPGCSIAYIWETGELFLKTKEALETNTSITLQAYAESKLSNSELASSQST